MDRLLKWAAMEDAPGYVMGSTDKNCANCSYNKSGHCDKYDFEVQPAFVCDNWEGRGSLKTASTGMKYRMLVDAMVFRHNKMAAGEARKNNRRGR